MSNLIYKELSYQIIGAAMEAHRCLGPGFLESVYQSALAYELTARNIPFEQFKSLPVRYKDIIAGQFEADFVVAGNIILELKAVSSLHPQHEAQAVNYLAATGLKLAILLNFGASSLEHKRLVKWLDHNQNA